MRKWIGRTGALAAMGALAVGASACGSDSSGSDSSSGSGSGSAKTGTASKATTDSSAAAGTAAGQAAGGKESIPSAKKIGFLQIVAGIESADRAAKPIEIAAKKLGWGY